MIQRETKLNVIDNTGAKEVKCIKVFNKWFGNVGDVVVVTIKKCLSHKKIKKGMIFKGVIVKTRKSIIRFGKNSIKNTINGIVLLKKNEKYQPAGTRIIGSVAFELRKKGYMKIISLALVMV